MAELQGDFLIWSRGWRSFNSFREPTATTVGEAMKGVGAGFQEGFSEFIEDVTPAAVKAAKGISNALKALGPVVLTLSKNLDTVAVSLAGALGAAGIAAIISQIVKAKGVVAALTAAVKALNLAMLKNPIFLAAMGGAIAVEEFTRLPKQYLQADEVERLNRVTSLRQKLKTRVILRAAK